MRFNCAVRGCRMKERNAGQTWGRKLRIPLHANPKNPVLSQKWKDILHVWNQGNVPKAYLLNNDGVPKSFQVCSAHFSPENVIVQFGRTKLAPNSVPTIQDSTHLTLNDAEKLEYIQKTEIKLELEEFENVEYLELDNVEASSGSASEIDPLNLYTVKEETDSDELVYKNTIQEIAYTNDKDINSTKRLMEIEEIFIESNTENHAENQCQAIISRPKEQNLRGNIPQRTSETTSVCKLKQEVNQKPVNLTNFYDCKLKVRKLDRIIKVLRVRNSRQTTRIIALKNNLSELQNKLSESNRTLSLLMEPDFIFKDSQSSP